jgi:broad specificity phosphatase PhoE
MSLPMAILASAGVLVRPRCPSPAACMEPVPDVGFDMRRLILVRHGTVSRELSDPPVRPGALYGGNYDVPLSPVGEAEAKAAARFIASQAMGDEVRFICSSPMSRALFGAKAVQSALSPRVIGGLKLETNDLLREIDRGEWANRTVAEVEADPRYGPGAYDRCAREPDYGREVAGGEGMADLRDRVLAARDYVLRGTRPGSASVVVSHMWVTRILLADALGASDVLQIDVPTASISVVDYPEGSWPSAAAHTAAQARLLGHKPVD